MPEAKNKTKAELEADIERLSGELEAANARLAQFEELGQIDPAKIEAYLSLPNKVEFVHTGYYVVDDVRYDQKDIDAGKVPPQIVEAIDVFNEAWGWIEKQPLND